MVIKMHVYMHFFAHGKKDRKKRKTVASKYSSSNCTVTSTICFLLLNFITLSLCHNCMNFCQHKKKRETVTC